VHRSLSIYLSLSKYIYIYVYIHRYVSPSGAGDAGIRCCRGALATAPGACEYIYICASLSLYISLSIYIHIYIYVCIFIDTFPHPGPETLGFVAAVARWLQLQARANNSIYVHRSLYISLSIYIYIYICVYIHRYVSPSGAGDAGIRCRRGALATAPGAC